MSINMKYPWNIHGISMKYPWHIRAMFYCIPSHHGTMVRHGSQPPLLLLLYDRVEWIPDVWNVDGRWVDSGVAVLFDVDKEERQEFGAIFPSKSRVFLQNPKEPQGSSWRFISGISGEWWDWQSRYKWVQGGAQIHVGFWTHQTLDLSIYIYIFIIYIYTHTIHLP